MNHLIIDFYLNCLDYWFLVNLKIGAFQRFWEIVSHNFSQMLPFLLNLHLVTYWPFSQSPMFLIFFYLFISSGCVVNNFSHFSSIIISLAYLKSLQIYLCSRFLLALFRSTLFPYILGCSFTLSYSFFLEKCVGILWWRISLERAWISFW